MVAGEPRTQAASAACHLLLSRPDQPAPTLSRISSRKNALEPMRSAYLGQGGEARRELMSKRAGARVAGKQGGGARLGMALLRA